MTTPRTTNRDARQLAAYWTRAFRRLAELLDRTRPQAAATLDVDRVKRAWIEAACDVDDQATIGDSSDAYAYNAELWRTSRDLASLLALYDETPEPFELVLAPGPGPRNGIITCEFNEGSFGKTWDKYRDELVQLRGSDLMEAPAGQVGRPMQVPRSTNEDIRQLAACWNAAWTKLEIKRALGQLTTEQGLDGLRTRWQGVLHLVDTVAKNAPKDAPYIQNQEFWRASLELATTLDAFNELPTPGQLLLDSVHDAWHALPERLANAATSVAHTVGDLAHEAGSGLFKGFATPLLVGGGALVGLYFLLRGRDRDRDLVEAA